MCAVSNTIQTWTTPSSPNYIPWTVIQNDAQLAAQMLEVIKRLEAIDKRLGLMEQCLVAEPEKKAIKRRLRKIAKNG